MSRLLEALLSGGKGLAEFSADTAASMISPAYKENLIARNRSIREEELRQRDLAFVDEQIGTRATQQPYDNITQELFREDNPQAQMPVNEIAGTGYEGGQITKNQLAGRLLAGGFQPSTRVTGGSILNKLLTQQHVQQPVGFDQYSQFDDNQMDRFDRFKGRQPKSPYSNMQIDQQTGQPFALNQQTGQFEQVPGQRMSAAKPTGYMTPKDKMGMENMLRDDYRAGAKTFDAMSNSYDRIRGAEQTGAGDIAMVFAYMKLLDPGSVVRENEFATAQNAAGIPEAVRGMWNSMMNGQKLTPAAREQIRSQSGAYYRQSQEQFQRMRGDFSANASDYGLNIRNIIGSPRESKPKIGDTRVNPETGVIQEWMGD